MAYESDFLGVPLPLPEPTDTAPVRLLDYEHFSVLLHRERRLALLTAVTIDGAALVDVPRGDDWRLDPRVPADEQAGPELYSRNDLDRGHLVRRRDPVWGEPAVARRAESDTFHYTNAAPQAADFNQSKELWLGLEDHVLAYAETRRSRLVVLTGCIFEEDDPVYRDIALPRRFWKIAAWVDGASVLRSTGFILDQSALVDDLESLIADDVPPLGPFRTFQVPVEDVAALTSLRMPELVSADVLSEETRRSRPRRIGDGWVTIISGDSIAVR